MQWIKQFGDYDYTVDGTQPLVNNLSVADTGDIFMAGDAPTGDFNFGGTTFTVAGSSEMILVKYDSDGNFKWINHAGGADYDTGAASAYDVSATPSGDAYVIGEFAGNMSFNGYELTSSGSTSYFVCSYTADGSFSWAKNFSHNNEWDFSEMGSVPMPSINSDADGNVFVFGSFSNKLSYEDEEIFVSDGSSMNYFLAKLDNAGNLDWAKEIELADNTGGDFYYLYDGSLPIVRLASQLIGDNIQISAGYPDNVTIDGYTLTAAGSCNTFIASCDTNTGDLITVANVGKGMTIDDWVQPIAISSGTPDSTYMIGNFHGDVNVSNYEFSSYGTGSFVCRLPKESTITSSCDANGAIAPSGSVVVIYGADQTFTITPMAEHRILDVLVDGKSVGAVESYTFSNVTANHTISATFALNVKTNLTFTSDPVGKATVTPSNGEFDSYTEIAIKVVPNTGYFFVEWIITPADAGTLGNPYKKETTFTAYKDATITAKLTDTVPGKTVDVVMAVSPGAGGTTTPVAGIPFEVQTAKAFKVYASADTGYYFDGWTATNGYVEFSDKTARVTYATVYAATATGTPVTLTANFADIPVNAILTMKASPSSGGRTIPGSGSIPTSKATPISATATSGWYFINWEIDGPGSIDDKFAASTKVMIYSNATVTAIFSQTAPVPAILTMAVSSPTLGTDAGEIKPTIGVHTVNVGTEVGIIATAAKGYAFAGWTSSTGSATIKDPNLEETTVTLAGAATVTANFTIAAELSPMQMSLSSAHKESLSKTKIGGKTTYTKHFKDTYSITVKIPLLDDLDLSEIDKSTQIGFTLGAIYDIADSKFLTLGDAQKKSFGGEKGGSATFLRLDENDKKKTTEKITFKWNKKKELVVTVTGKPMIDNAYNILYLSDDIKYPVGPIMNKKITGMSLRFGGLSWDGSEFEIPYSGKKTSKPVTKGNEDFDLMSWSVKGKYKKQ